MSMAIVLGACAKANPFGRIDSAYGVVTAVSPNDSVRFVILRDDSAVLNVLRYDTPSYGVQVGQRVLFDYSILGYYDKTFSVRVLGFNQLLVKDLDYESYLNAVSSRQDSIGHDAISCSVGWFGGDYINISYEYMCGTTGVRHLISLVYDDTVNDTYANIYLRHNAAGETSDAVTLSPAYGLASFRLSQLIPVNEHSLPIRLHWSWYDTQNNIVELSGTGTFIPFDHTTSGNIR